jgi:hypothetical protein
MRPFAIPILSRMSRRTIIPLLAAGVLAAATGGLAACGDSGDGNRLSRSTAAQLTATLDRLDQDVSAGNCDAAATQARALVERTGGLADSVDSDLRGALVDSADRLQVLVSERCPAAATGPTGPSEAPSTAETGATGPAGKKKKQEKPEKPEKEKDKGKKHEETGTTGGDQSGTTGGDGQDNQDSGGVAP